MLVKYINVIVCHDFRGSLVRFEIQGSSKEEIKSLIAELKKSLEPTPPTTDDVIDFLKKKLNKSGVRYTYSVLN